MSIDRIVLAFAGTMILITTLLAVVVSKYWLLATGFVGANLAQSAFTRFCPLAIVLGRLGCQPGQVYRCSRSR
jgi:hypothetical protein